MRQPLRLTPGGAPAPGRVVLSLRQPLLVYATIDDWAPAAETPGLVPDPGDAERLRALRTDRLRRRFLASRLLLRSTLAALSGRAPGQLPLARTALGRPYAPDLPGLEFSLSHTGSLLTVAVLRGGRVGVDAEQPGRHMSVLEHRMCTPHERLGLDVRRLRGAPRDAELLRLWTLKEAFSKVMGTGLRLPPNTFSLESGDPAGRPDVRDARGRVLTGGWSADTHTLSGATVSVVAAYR